MAGRVERVTLDVRSAARLPWHLRPGQLVLVEVVEHNLRGATVNLGGALFPARGNLPAEAGARFWGLVEGASREAIHLRRLAPAPAGKPGEDDLPALLGLPPDDDEAAAVVREFMRWRLPLDRRAILEVAAALRRVPVAARGAFREVRVWLRTLNLPEDAVRAVEAYLLGEPEEGEGDALPGSTAARGQLLLNRAAAALPGTGLLALALLARQAAGDVYVMWDKHASHEQDTCFRFVIHLVSRNCGSIWVVLAMWGTDLGVEIFCDPDRAELIRQGVAALREELADGGFRVTSCTVHPRRVASVVELLERPELPGYTVLDVTV
ncbi:MAG: hypothetical protein AB1776_06540 [Bacillota bacterium]